MQLDFKVKNESLLVNFNGELDHHTAKYVRDKIDEAYADHNTNNIVIDLNNLNFMDSSGIGLLMGRYKIVTQKGGNLSIINVSPRVEKILKMSGILKIVNILDTDQADKFLRE
ncbi:anti-sigma F factor antagonist SpoIIAA [Gottschalkia acidurici 9a]|uniref:Anti-sigma F factor antagonist n=1 Tax=Gottschalkia acidurici (strain ATCC 7906 / DSM 604 / BCRC 14475 / CIP 104303 / KCTC 5404 / NCIMB 10678 / 9a) TaxID=1128398 RepID=K0AVY3_GOTA9|nr:anti-sigma F factor antagonist [Gottschalkia acidurici]AFS78043.1 anti-sigma F factor antagonist SpoIIAA [Gottschalkia acidurici 9a]